MKKKISLPYIILAIVSTIWICLFPYFSEDFMNNFYYMPFLGTIAATVANTTPAAAGIVYFPIFNPPDHQPCNRRSIQFNHPGLRYGAWER